MLTIEQISGNFPLPLRQRNPRGLLVEYLQYELLDSLFKNEGAAGIGRATSALLTDMGASPGEEEPGKGEPEAPPSKNLA